MLSYKSVVAVATVVTMVASSAFAADTALAPGKPAGTHQAQLEIGTGTLILGLGAAAVIAGVAITVSNQSSNNAPVQTFTAVTTGTTG